jgi:uncharacterized protein (TIRG00374 family)
MPPPLPHAPEVEVPGSAADQAPPASLGPAPAGGLWAALRGRALRRLAISLLLGAGFVWLFRRGGLPLFPNRAAFSTLSAWVVPVYLGASWLAAYFRTFRWVHLLRPIAPGVHRFRVLGIGFVGYAAVFLSPLRIGEVVRPYLLSRDRQVSFFQALGTVGAERVIDGLLLTLLSFTTLSLAPQVSPLPNHLGNLPIPVAAVPAALYSALILFASALTAMAVFYRARSFAQRLIERTIGLVSPHLAGWVTNTLARLAEGLSFLPSRTHLTRFLRDTVLYWGLVIAAQWLLLRGVGLHPTPAEACVTLGVMGLGTLIPSGPGFFGAYQLSAFTALSLFYPLSDVLSRGAAFVFISYCVQLSTNILSLLPGYYLVRRFPASIGAS